MAVLLTRTTIFIIDYLPYPNYLPTLHFLPMGTPKIYHVISSLLPPPPRERGRGEFKICPEFGWCHLLRWRCAPAKALTPVGYKCPGIKISY